MGSLTPIADAEITSSSGPTTTSDAGGRFELRLAPGRIELAIRAATFEPLRVVENTVAGQGITVEYRLLGLPRFHRYETTVRGEARHEGDRFILRAEELQQMPGTLGDPFKVIGLLPGVAQPIPLLPVFVIRGGSPGSNGFFLDGMRIPQVNHLVFGGSVVHPRLLERIDVYPGSYDASFGRYAGGVIDSETRPARAGGPHGEVELRPLDGIALAEVGLPHGIRIAASGHYGQPGPLFRLFQPGIDQKYWDYFLRFDWRGVTIEAIGSYDSLAIPRSVTLKGADASIIEEYNLTFHRLQIRDRTRRGPLELESAIVGGVDEMAIFSGQGVQKLGLSARIHAKVHLGWFTLFTGVDGELSRFQASRFATDKAGARPDELGELASSRDGVVGSAFLQGTAEIFPKRLALTLGGRTDVYHAGVVTLLGIDPRVNLRARLMPQLTVTAGFGLYQQPPGFPVPLPGIDTYALQLGLQRSWQGAVGIEADLPFSFNFRLTGYYTKLFNSNDIVIDVGPALCTTPPPESLSGLPAQVTRQVDGVAYGMEMLLRRTAGRFTGWLAYTLSDSQRIFSCGLRPADFKQGHVLNLVLEVQLPWRLIAGLRLGYASGRPFTHLDPTDRIIPPRNNDSFADFLQLDLRIGREWIFPRWALAVFIEGLNLTYSDIIFGIQYKEIDEMKRYDLPPEFQAIRVIIPWLGIRGRI
ncbi:MAG: hypothetical protein EXR72_22760 [Myxococcales bacterium]|nr:hypothetical protein [Myxococcales bacterium]